MSKNRPSFMEHSQRPLRVTKIGGGIAAAGAALAVAALIVGLVSGARGTGGEVLFGLTLTGFGLLVVGAVIAAAAGRTPPASPEEARRRRSFAMIVWGAVALGLGLLGVANEGNAAALVVAVLGIGLLVGGLVIRR